MVHFEEINQAPSPYAMLHHIGRIATLKLVPRNCLRYLEKLLKEVNGDWTSRFINANTINSEMNHCPF